jgi:hypothetical protein
MWDAQQANAVAGYLFHAQPGRGAGFVWTLPAFPERVARMERSDIRGSSCHCPGFRRSAFLRGFTARLRDGRPVPVVTPI